MRPARRLLGLALGRRLPRVEGTLRVAGLGAPVTIRRDGFGIPHVEAANGEDAWFALGLCHVQDRAFQLDFTDDIQQGAVITHGGEVKHARTREALQKTGA